MELQSDSAKLPPLLLLLLLVAVPGWAALGDSVATVQNDQAHMKASLRSTQTDKYVVHELQSQSGTVVREYVSPAGQVFGIAWEGPFMPDLRQVLGTHFERFAQAAQARRPRGGPLVINEPGLVVESAGHMRSFFGRAYVPEMVPSGVQAESIR